MADAATSRDDQPIQTERTAMGPAATEPAATELTATRPAAATEPAAAQPATAQPATAQPGTAQPAATRPAAARPAADAPQVFVLQPAPPVRALAISAAAAVAGAIVIVLASHPAVMVLGWTLLGFGVVLAVVALVLTARLRSTVRVTPVGLEVSRGGRRGSLAWTKIERVQESGHRLIAIAGSNDQDLVITVPGRRGAAYLRLLGAIKQHLDDSRGYRN